MSQTTDYDVANRTVSVTDFNGNTTVSQYDQQGRVVQTTFADGVTMRSTYTASGQIETVTDSHGTTRYSYTGDGQLQSVTDVNGVTVSYGYDELGRKKSVIAPSGTTEYAYNQFGQLTVVTAPDKTKTRYTYDEFGNRASLIFPNGITTTYQYDTLNRLIGVETRNLSNALLASYAYTLNAKGQRTRVVEGAGGPATRTIEYTYDAADRLIKEQIADPALGTRTISYTYDPVGNRMQKDDNGVVTEYEYDANDRLLTEGGFAYTYDNNGNLLTKTGNGENWQLTYNMLNQVTQATIARPGGTTTAAYAYDHDGIRIGKTINGTDVINYIVDKNRPYAQVIEEQRTHPNPSQNGNISYVYGDALISAATAGATRYYHADGMGSIRGVSDAAGNMTDSYTYDAYGMLLHQTGATANPYLYRGEQYDADLSAYYLRARYYQPGNGRFLTTDPMEGMIGDPLSAHRYLYGYDDPIHQIDPSGRMSLNEAVVTTGIISALSSIGVAAIGSTNEKIGATIADWLPDAGIVGLSFTGQFRAIQMWLMMSPVDNIAYLGNTVRMFQCPADQLMGNGTAGGGVEVIFSLPSAELGAFVYGTAMGEFGVGNFDVHNTTTGDLINVSATIYHGGLFNLWNVAEYSGKSVGVSLGIGNYGGSIFKGWPINGNTPWGVTAPVATFSTAKHSRVNVLEGVGGSFYFRLLADKWEFESPYSVAWRWMATEVAVLGIAAAKRDVEGLFTSAIAVSWPLTIANLKTIWNKHNTSSDGRPYSIKRRRDEPRPLEYHSGPNSPF